jgi:cytidylate kinase
MFNQMSGVEKCLRPRFLITGETPGTGASTTSKILAEQLKLPIISGGRYFRGIANRFHVFQQEHSHFSVEDQYLAFLDIYQEAFLKNGLVGALALLEEGIEQGAKGDVLARFSAAVEDNQKKTGQIDKVWDYIVDQKTVIDALTQPGFIWESKLAIVSLYLDQLRAVISEIEDSTLPFLSVLLSLDPVIAAQRVAQREDRQVNVEEILIRKQRDFDRYSDLYQINGRKVSHDDLFKYADIVINTENITAHRVAVTALGAYVEKVSLLTYSPEAIAVPMLIDMNNALTNLRFV